MGFEGFIVQNVLIIYTCMSEAFLTYKSDVCLDCIVYYSLLFIFIILHK